jgi:S1-C subfamily serine protease
MRVNTRAGLVIGLLLFTLTPNIGFAASLLEEATVNLYCRIKVAGRTYSATGSGVLVHQTGVILTNAHVGQYFLLGSSSSRTKTECTVRGGSPANDKYDATLLYLSPSWARETVEETTKKQPGKGTGESDFALLRIVATGTRSSQAFFPAVALDMFTTLEDGDEVVAAGYPAEDLNFRQVLRNLAYRAASSTLTAINSFQRPYQDVLTLAPSMMSVSGVSGGPIALPDDKLIGIAVTVSKGTESERSLRGITLSYIDRALRSETGLWLQTYISNPFLPAIDPQAQPYTDLSATLERTLRNTR